jgi:hypothetical protein
MAPAVERVSLDLLLEVTDHLQEFDYVSGERWPFLLPESKQDVLNARAVCKGFRDALWPAYSNVLAERGFFLIQPDLDILRQIAIHPVLRGLTKTITFGGQCFSKEGLDLFNHVIEKHPTCPLRSLGHFDDAWQLGLAHLVQSDVSKVLKARERYRGQLEAQEASWVSGNTVTCLKSILAALPRLQTIRIRPRPLKAPMKVAGHVAGSHCHASSTALYPTRFREWRDLRRVSEALSSIEGLVDFRLSYFSNVGLPLLRLSVFRHLHTAKLTLTEYELARDEEYHEDLDSGLQVCLNNAPGLTALDIAIKYSNSINYRSKILATMAATTKPTCYKLQHLCLERASISEENLSSLVTSQASNLRSLILVLPWIRPGSWESFLGTLIREGIYLDYLEIFKPSQGAVSYYENMDWIELDLLMRVAKEGRLIRFEGELDNVTGEWLGGTESWAETWENSYPREGRR